MARVMARVLIPDADGSRSRWRDGAQFAYTATLFVFGAGDGNRTRTVSLGRVLILPCFPVLQRYWRPQLASGDPYRPGLVAGVWPGSLGSRVENRTLAQSRERLLAAFDVLAPCVHSSRRPSKSPTPATQHAYTPATTSWPSPRASPRPPARPAPPTLNSSASNWRCCWTAPRPAAESSPPRPSPPPPPSQPSSSRTPSPPPLDRAAIERAASRQARRHGSISAPQLASDHAKDFAANSSWPCIGVLVAGEMAGGSRGSNCAAKVG